MMISHIQKVAWGIIGAVMLTIWTPQSFAQESVAYEGKKVVQEGDGGAKKTIDSIDFWSDGAPPRKFKLLGFITDRRHKTGIWGMISMSNLESSVADLAKQQGPLIRLEPR